MTATPALAPHYPPQRREPVRVARGTYCSLNTNRRLLLDGELCYAEDLRAIFVAEERNGQMELVPIRTTVRPEPMPPLRFHGFVDVTDPALVPVGPRHGDVVVALATGPADSLWAGLNGAVVHSGDQLIFDQDIPGWRNIGATVEAPAWFVDLTLLPQLP